MMSTRISSLVALLGFVQQQAVVEAKNVPWTCQQLEQRTDAFYRMFPAHLGTSKMDEDSSFVLQNIQGHCFMNIDVHTTLTEEEDALKANIVFDFDQSIGFCLEHIQISTAFSDWYNFYLFGG